MLTVRTEYSFKEVYGHVPSVVAAAGEVAVYADPNTWGHIPFYKAMRKAGKRPGMGLAVEVVRDGEKERARGTRLVLVPRSRSDLTQLYQLNTRAHDPEHFYYRPRLWWSDLRDFDGSVLAVDFAERLNGLDWWELALPGSSPRNGGRILAASFNFYPRVSDREIWELYTGKTLVQPGHIMSVDELWARGLPVEATEKWLADLPLIELSAAENIHYGVSDPNVALADMCWHEMGKRGLVENDVYCARLKRELELIELKGFADYFLVIADLVAYAKQHMFVGPSRGSSAGSLVCFLTRITEIDPLQHDLIFERFIDVNREDLPDIDIDFPDSKRAMVWDYIVAKYGAEKVGHLGTVMTYKPRSALIDVAKALNVPAYETEAIKQAIVERSSGDARAAFCLEDTFALDIGREFLEKYPKMRLAARLEGHARQSGQHAAGYIICNEPVQNYCSVARDAVTQMDKIAAEELNILKIDALGLRTLSVIGDALEAIGGISYEDMYRLPLDDEETFKVFQDMRLAGIFQFEGDAVRMITRQARVERFEDIVALTALARPGPLHSGGTSEWIDRRCGGEVRYQHPMMEKFTGETFGTVIYQEQVMLVARMIGKLSWEDVSTLRKAMSKSLGDEFFGKYWEQFCAGAIENGLDVKSARTIWDNICTFGSWAFNKSHAVSYGLISYWCAWLKAHHPLEFALGCLKNARADDASLRLLREMVKEGIEYVPVDAALSDVDWSVKEGKLVGGLTNVKGIGPKKALEIVIRRNNGIALAPGMQRLLDEAVTPFDDLFPAMTRFRDIYENPEKHKIYSTHVSQIVEVIEDGYYVVIGKLVQRNLRDLNEAQSLNKRGGKVIENNSQFFNLVIEDDSDTMLAQIDRWNFSRFRKLILEESGEGDWFLWGGTLRDGRRKLKVDKVRKL